MNDSARSAPHMSRRDLFRCAGAAGLALGVVPGLAACDRGDDDDAVQSGPPRRGGTLRVGIVGGGKSESFNPSTGGITLINVAMVNAVFDGLVRVGPDLSIQPGLATRWESDASATTWELTLREGVTWHDGKRFTADDVVYSLRWMGRPDNGLQNVVAGVDLDGLQKLGPTRVRVPLKRPDLSFPMQIAPSWIVQDGAKDFTEPVGTGAFRFESLNQGQRSVCIRNPDYWDDPKPYVDSLVIQSIDDNTARLNALLAGELDLMAQLPYAQAAAQKEQGQIALLDAPTTNAAAFYMRVDVAPFDDVRVRQALKLLVDRKALIETTLGGYGTVANDLIGLGVEFYAADIPQRDRDVEQAKSLLARAGHGSGLSVTLQTSTAVPGMVEAATLYKQQAKEGGVDVQIEQVPANAYFDPTLKYLKMPFAQTFWIGILDLPSFYDYGIKSSGISNETHWYDKRTDALIGKAETATDKDQAASYWQQVQQQQWAEGGYIVWGNPNNLDGASNRVAGIKPSKYLFLGLPTGFADAYFPA
jgi:peptide/nickel transport system substrate-binding protein